MGLSAVLWVLLIVFIIGIAISGNDDKITLEDGVLGEYGKEMTIPSQTYGKYTYVWYTVPYGGYSVKNLGNRATIFIVSDKNTQDVRNTVYFTYEGQSNKIIVPEGYHIELSGGAKILLIP